jgi:hypothetical protein
LSRLGRGVLFVEGKNNTEYLPDIWKAVCWLAHWLRASCHKN